MLELPIYTRRKKIELEPEIAKKFEHPIIFYLAHRDDSRAFLITFVILDFAESELLYITSYSDTNLKKVESHPDEKILRLMRQAFNPHCTIQITPGEDFLTFVENGYYFYYVNYKNNIMKVYTGTDLPCAEKNNITEFGSTFYRDDEDREYFYFTAISRNGQDGKLSLNFYRSSFDLSYFVKIYSSPSFSRSAPHATRKFKKYLMNSNFTHAMIFKNIATGKIFNDSMEYMRFVYMDLYRQFCKKNSKEFRVENFLESIVSKFGRLELESVFNSFCLAKGENFMEICKNDEKYAFETLPGTVTLIDLENRTMDFAETTVCAPAHFEIDEKSGIIFSSAHNFTILDKVYFLGPAAIDKFVIENGKLVKVGTFLDARAFRFTTHRLFHYKDKPYICAFAQPNRLYFIDAVKMEKFYHDDIGEDVLSDQVDILNFINGGDIEPCFKTIEVSKDGETLFLLGNNNIYFYSFPGRKIIAKIPYRASESVGEIPLKHFYKRTTHSNYLD